MTPGEIRRAYDRYASWYDRLEWLLEALLLRRLRRRLLARAHGRVLDVAGGTGANLPWLPSGCRVTLADLSAGMIAVARRKSRRIPVADLMVAAAERLPFADAVFDTVVTSLATCTFADPVAAAREMSRVCRPGGRILLLEHGRSGRAWLARWQDRHAEAHARRLGCWWNRDPIAVVRAAGLEPKVVERRLAGALYAIDIVNMERVRP